MNLTADNYFSREANMEYCSVSQIKAFMKCPAAALAELHGEYQREQTTALLVGSYVDAWFSGEMEQFKAEHPEIFKRDGTLKAEYTQADQIIARVSKDEMFMEYMSGNKQVIMTGEIDGVPFKIKIDSLLSDRITDLKIVRDFETIYDPDFCSRVPWWVYWKYDLQGGAYQEIVRQNLTKSLPFFLAAATKEKVTDYNIYQIVQSDLDVALQIVKDNIVRFEKKKKGIIQADRCECCDYCRSTKKLTEVISSDSILI